MAVSSRIASAFALILLSTNCYLAANAVAHFEIPAAVGIFQSTCCGRENFVKEYDTIIKVEAGECALQFDIYRGWLCSPASAEIPMQLAMVIRDQDTSTKTPLSRFEAKVVEAKDTTEEEIQEGSTLVAAKVLMPQTTSLADRKTFPRRTLYFKTTVEGYEHPILRVTPGLIKGKLDVSLDDVPDATVQVIYKAAEQRSGSKSFTVTDKVPRSLDIKVSPYGVTIPRVYVLKYIMGEWLPMIWQDTGIRVGREFSGKHDDTSHEAQFQRQHLGAYDVIRKRGGMAITLHEDPKTKRLAASLHPMPKGKPLPKRVTEEGQGLAIPPNTAAVLLPVALDSFQLSRFLSSKSFVHTFSMEAPGTLKAVRVEIPGKTAHVIETKDISAMSTEALQIFNPTQMALHKNFSSSSGSSSGGRRWGRRGSGSNAGMRSVDKISKMIQKAKIKAVAIAFEDTLVGSSDNADDGVATTDHPLPYTQMLSLINGLLKKKVQVWIISQQSFDPVQLSSFASASVVSEGHYAERTFKSPSGRTTAKIQFQAPTKLAPPSAFSDTMSGGPLIGTLIANANQKVEGTIKVISAPVTAAETHFNEHLMRIAAIGKLSPQQVLFVDINLDAVKSAFAIGFSAAHALHPSTAQLAFDIVEGAAR